MRTIYLESLVFQTKSQSLHMYKYFMLSSSYRIYNISGLRLEEEEEALLLHDAFGHSIL